MSSGFLLAVAFVTGAWVRMAEPAVLAPTVELPTGRVRGTVEQTLLDHREYFAFRGIPYGKAPIGMLRFKAPVASESWQGVLDGSTFGPPCVQPNMHMTSFIGAEDCLTLNVFTPAITGTGDAGLPVIVYVHGGAFLMGSARGIGPDILLNERIVLVTINYRLGPFGFLVLADDEFSGNMGLKDQLLALEWVHNNIRSFGGDPAMVTLYGHSAGGVAAHMHVLSTASRPFFRRAIISGASAFVPWAYGRLNHTKIMAQMAGASGDVPAEQLQMDAIVRWLQSVDAAEFAKLNTHPFFVGGTRRKFIDFTWMPVIEANSANRPFLTQSVYESAQQANPIDTLFSFTDSESLLLTGIDLNSPATLKSFDEHFEVQLPLADLAYDPTTGDYKALAKEIRQFYFDNRTVDASALLDYVRLLSDSFFIYGIHRAVDAQTRLSTGRTFLVKFAGDLKLNFFRRFANATMLDIPGATHTEEMCYVFRLSEMENLIDESEYERLSGDSPEGQMAKTLVGLIANFAHSGDPLPQKTPVDFREVGDATNMNYLTIANDGMQMNTEPRQQSIQFWNGFFRKHGHKLNLP